MKRNLIQPVKGTRDFYPEKMAERTWLYQTIRAVAEKHGYQEWEGPALEPIALYAAKSGEELVKEQSFILTDRGGDDLALRPELTPTLARMIAQRQAQLPRPIRWWSFGPFWRYERPQKGRTREFLQWNIDLLGIDTPEADAELVAIAAAFFRAAGLSADSVILQVNNRRLMDRALVTAGIGEDARPIAFRAIDKREKLSPSAWKEYVASLGFGADQIDALQGLMENRELWRESDELIRLFELLDAYGIREMVEFEPSVIRGLDYYTGTVFEARDADGEFRAILGGGRYDNLVSDVGGQPVPGVGFAMGDVVIALVLKKYGCLPEFRTSPTQVLVTIFSEEMTVASVRLAARLRDAGISTEIYPALAKMAKQFRYADQLKIPFAIVLGPEEAKEGRIALKDMSSGEQASLSMDEAIADIRGRLGP